MEIEKRNAWQNKPHKTSKSMAGEQGKRNAWQNKPHKTSKLMPEGEQGKNGDRQKKCMAK
jgi:hypothetical protein